MRRFRSLTSRLTATAVALVAVVALGLGLATTLMMRHSLTQQLDRDLVEAADRAGQFLGAPLPAGTPDDIGLGADRRPPQDLGTLNVYISASGVYEGFYLTVDSEDRFTVKVLDENVLDELADVPLDGRPHDVQLEGLGSYRVLGTDDGQDRVVGLPTADVDDAVAALVWTEVLLGLLAVMVAGGAATVVVRRQLGPLREVAATARAVAATPLSSGEVGPTERVPDHLTDEQTEVGRVGAALNTLLAHVETSLDARHRSEQQVRQFVADASHELRTPLATITGYTELARRRPDDPVTSVTALAKVEEESARMTHLVEDLLLLARLDAGRPLRRDTVDLTRLLLEAVADARVVAPQHHWRLELPEQAIEVTGDEQRLHQVVTNLLTNARKHTPAGTTVTVTGRADGFTVSDDGPGFPPELAGAAFERFTRGDSARTREEGGAGLGLALVEAIVRAHGGSVSLHSARAGARIDVSLSEDPG